MEVGPELMHRLDRQSPRPDPASSQEKITMLRVAVLFLVIALIAGLFGFVGVASYSWEGARILFVVFLVLAVLSFLMGGWRRRNFVG